MTFRHHDVCDITGKIFIFSKCDEVRRWVWLISVGKTESIKSRATPALVLFIVSLHATSQTRLNGGGLMGQSAHEGLWGVTLLIGIWRQTVKVTFYLMKKNFFQFITSLYKLNILYVSASVKAAYGKSKFLYKQWVKWLSV